ncbi:pentatricopeptide repeat-containing protein At5g39350 isoform X1 [Selaginella moellendorffii]|uniref:pentatricopeptide repeat-containing protein At5g39350 isoform X1 n=1 Tax=Selaginella moellendorffii TaxID=88036 RepID=UPI000D1C3C2F|nr:pentatricopeptide repeat-containing protein At5g39350 isoform X1 [Selaginella moellendorffii]|eukprot:XP_024527226.1 pentatricopeptide repeat-containing protein At5g39350 isoform X1 [Selaginella moellendorffii]
MDCLSLDLPDAPVKFSSYASLLRQTKTLEQGKLLHAHIEKFGHSCDTFLGNLLVQMYGRCQDVDSARAAFDSIVRKNVFSWSLMLAAYAQNGHLDDARKVFDHIPERNVVCWNSIMAFYAENGRQMDALHLLAVMDLEGVPPSDVTVLVALESCGAVGWLTLGQCLHESRACELGLVKNAAVGAALVTMYGKCGSIERARSAFVALPKRNVVCWTSMIAALAENAEFSDAVGVFRSMIQEGLKPDAVALITVLDACASLGSLAMAESVYSSGSWQWNPSQDVRIGNAAVNMFGKCGSVERSMEIFDAMEQRNIVSWTGMVAAFAQNRCFERALGLFRTMDLHGVFPDEITFVSAIVSCGSLGDLATGRLLHQECCAASSSNFAIASALIDMYARCDHIELARAAFDAILPYCCKVGAWNSIISAYARNRQGREAMQIFRAMDLDGVAPNAITLITLLDACANTPSLAHDRFIHSSIADLQTLEHDRRVKNALINMYGKGGNFSKARSIFKNIRHAGDIVTWTAMVEAYAQNGYGNMAVATFMEMELEGIIPNEITFTSIVSACTHSGLVNQGLFFFASQMEDYGIAARSDQPLVGIVDLLSRSGHISEAAGVIDSMPFRPHSATLTTILSACRIHGDRQTGSAIARKIAAEEPESRATYQLLSNIYAEGASGESQ